MNYKNIIMGVIFAVVIIGIEDGLNLKSYSILIPAVLVVVMLMLLKSKMSNRSK